MKKTAAYVSTAILLGCAIMMLPLALGSHPQSLSPVRTFGGEENKYGNTSGFYGVGSQPLNLLPSSLVFFSGLIIALGAYAVLKRRTA